MQAVQPAVGQVVQPAAGQGQQGEHVFVFLCNMFLRKLCAGGKVVIPLFYCCMGLGSRFVYFVLQSVC